MVEIYLRPERRGRMRITSGFFCGVLSMKSSSEVCLSSSSAHNYPFQAACRRCRSLRSLGSGPRRLASRSQCRRTHRRPASAKNQPKQHHERAAVDVNTQGGLPWQWESVGEGVGPRGGAPFPSVGDDARTQYCRSTGIWSELSTTARKLRQAM